MHGSYYATLVGERTIYLSKTAYATVLWLDIASRKVGRSTKAPYY